MPQPASGNLITSPWSLAQKIAFRACFLFFIQYILLGSNEIVPETNPIYAIYIQPFYKMIPWIGQHILHLSYPITSFPDGGSSDTTFDYVMLLLSAVVTFVGVVIWSLVDRRRPHHRRLYYWFTLILRYYCAYTMFIFGLSKAYKLQFPFPSPGSLIEPLGAYSPMHLVWSFFGYSSPYTRITGWAEIVSGILLMYRSTTRLGVLFFLVVMFNVTAVNFFYDVCLKTTSAVLMMMGLFLLAPELKKLIQFFIQNKAVAPSDEWTPIFQKKWINISLILIKFALTIAILVNANRVIVDQVRSFADDRPVSRLHGIYNVQMFVRNKDTLPPLLTDTIRWRRLLFNDLSPYAFYASIRQMNDSAKGFMVRPDTLTGKIAFFRSSDTAKKYYFDYTFIGKDSLYLRGNWKGDSLSILLKKYETGNFLLINRGFHWINEAPYQR